MTVFIERQSMEATFSPELPRKQVDLQPINDAAAAITWAKQRANLFLIDLKGKVPSASEIFGNLKKHSSFFVGENSTGERMVFGVVPEARVRQGNEKNLTASALQAYKYASKMLYLGAVRSALGNNQINEDTAGKIAAEVVGKMGMKDRVNPDDAIRMLSEQRYLEKNITVPSGAKAETDSNKDGQPQDKNIYTVPAEVASAAALVGVDAQRRGSRKVSKVLYAGSVGLLLGDLALAACGPVLTPTPNPEKPTTQSNTSFPTEQAPFDVSYSGTNLKGEIVKSTGEIPSGVTERTKKAIEKQGLSWDKVTVFGLGLQDGSGNVESPIFAITEDAKPGEAGMYFYTEAGDFAVPLLVPPGTGKDGSGFLVPMAYSFNADRTRMRWGLASEDRNGNLELGDANAILFTFELDASGKITKVTYSDPYSKKNFSWLTDNVPDNLKKIHDYAISHSTSGQKATETPAATATKAPEATPAATATASFVDGETDPALIQEFAVSIDCRDSRGCVREVIGSPSKIEMDVVATGKIKTVRLLAQDGKEYATSIVAEMVTRAQNGQGKAFWIPLRTERDDSKGENSDRNMSGLIILNKLHGTIKEANSKELFPIEWFQKWIVSGSQWGLIFEKSGAPFFNSYKGSQFSNPEYIQKVKEFLSSKGNTFNFGEEPIMCPSGGSSS